MDTEKFRNGAAYVGGKFVPFSEAAISVADWGFTRSDAVYDVVHVDDYRFFRLKDHVERFEASMKKRRIDVGLSTQEIEVVLHRVVALSGLSSAYVAMVALRGRPRVVGSRRPEDCTNHLVAYAVPWVDVISKEMQETGATLWISEHPRVPDASVDPAVKNYQWSDLTSALFEAHDHGYETAVLCDAEGFVTEGPGFNVFVVKEGRLVTPDRGALPGITRKTILELCAELGVPHSIGPVSRSDLQSADEVFISSSAGGVMPVRQVSDGGALPGSGGTVFRSIREAYWSAHKRPLFSTPVEAVQA
ncbi:branched-chain amino acid--2-keto-4-methylthiobutyrate aminotransferase [Ottowia thiooxydans]|uniref:branched-chain amino acid--2-keto-4-methylthiobutyrate aminotransferase n=1 Tax=Ottowia thiooxydans TaxID=219182 RepID=UPI0004092168|nr:branched-chain amino acid--2-keto-4-methylthiobutyrate aminotransferase [Ottowia thiooxydans]